jgi:hypothetical protein
MAKKTECAFTYTAPHIPMNALANQLFYESAILLKDAREIHNRIMRWHFPLRLAATSANH